MKPLPDWCEWIGFSVSCFGFLITLLTLKTSLSVKKQLIQRKEIQLYQTEKDDLIAKLNSFIDSIMEDHIFSYDDDNYFHDSLEFFLVGIESKFSFLSRKPKRKIIRIQKQLKNPQLLKDDWKNIATLLIKLKDNLDKEIL